MNIKSLQELCNVHSVSGDTKLLIEYLQKRLKQLKIPFKVNGFGVLLFGNLKNPKILISAHADEVGFQIIKQNEDGTFLVTKSGHFGPALANNSSVYVMTSIGRVPGVFYAKRELGNNNPQNFNEVFLDTIDKEAVEVGDYGTYNRVFHHKGDKIIATALDNKATVQMVLELIEENPNLAKNCLFAFVTEEELGYDCIAGVGFQYQPEYALVLDMAPVQQTSGDKCEILPKVGHGPAVLLAAGSYHLHEDLRKKLKKLKTKFQYATIDLPFLPEPAILQRNGTTKGANIIIPMLGWHNVAYTMSVKDFMSMKELVVEYISLLK